MDWLQKLADIAPGSAASPLPQIEVSPKPAPGLRGPKGLGPRTNYSRVNSGAPQLPDAGAAAQKSMAPMGASMLPTKTASEGRMGTMMPTPTLQDMVKAALAGAQSRAQLSAEAARQQNNLGEGSEEKSASKMAASSEGVTTEYAEKLAEAIEFALPQIKKATIGEGPNTLKVMEAKAEKPIPENKGQGHHQPPMNPGMGKGPSSGDPGNQMENDAARAPGGSAKMAEKNLAKMAGALKKVASDKTEQKETEGMAEAKRGLDKVEKAHEQENSGEKKASTADGSLVDYMRSLTKQAEDAISPAKISAGAAVAPETSAAGESGGAPAGGQPQGPTSLVGSNESAINYNKNQAKAPVKSDMNKFYAEPALNGGTDSALRAAFEHSSASDNNKFASTQGATKTAAARALLAKLAEAAQEKVSK